MRWISRRHAFRTVGLRGGLQLLCPHTRHVDCGCRQTLPSMECCANFLPLRSGDRGGRVAAAGKSTTRSARYERQIRAGNHRQGTGGSAARRSTHHCRPAVRDREVVFLSNGHYSTMLTADRCRLLEMERTGDFRWKAIRQKIAGERLYLPARNYDGQWWSATADHAWRR